MFRKILSLFGIVAALVLAIALGLFVALPHLMPKLRTPITQEQSGEHPKPKQAQRPKAQVASIKRPAVPDVDGLVMLIRTSLVALDQANRTNNYSVLRELAAPAFQKRNSSSRLSELFVKLRGRNVDLSAVNVVNPRLVRNAAVDESGYLRIAGFVPSRPEQVQFELVFQLVNGRWRIFGIAVDTRDVNSTPGGETNTAVDTPKVQSRPAPNDALLAPNPQPPLPDIRTVVALIRSAIVSVNQANITGNYSVLRELAAPEFQRINGHSRLTEVFSGLRKNKIDFDPVTVIVPRLASPPKIDDRGLLRVSGAFPRGDGQANFDLSFQLIGDEWKLYTIGLNTARRSPPQVSAPAPAPPASAPAPAAQSVPNRLDGSGDAAAKGDTQVQTAPKPSGGQRPQ